MAKTDVVSAVNFYPLKGGRAATINGEVPRRLIAGATGFEVSTIRDRDWVIYDPNEGAFVSQRGWGAQNRRVHYPQDRRLATVRLDVRGTYLAVKSRVGQLDLPAAPTEGRPLTLDIFGKQFAAIEQGKEASSYFSRLLEREVLLVRSDREHPCMLPERYRREKAFNQVAGADGMPFLLTSEASLAEAHQANNMPPGAIPINRYRGNIVIRGDGLGPFGEDYIDGQTQFRIGNVGAWVVKACSRCPVPDVDQDTGEVTGGALRVLRGRAGSIFTGEQGVFFGQNLVHANLAAISVGDVVTVEDMSPTPNIDFRSAA